MTEHVTLGNPPSEDDLRQMTPEQAMIAGAEVDGVHIVHRRDRFPIPGTQAEKRVERAVALCFVLAALAGVIFIVVFIVWPYKFALPGNGQTWVWFTPLIGGLLGVMLLMTGMGAVLWGKWLMPEEEVVQERHDDPSAESDQLMTAATITVGIQDTGLPRRKLLTRTLMLAGGAIATTPLFLLFGALARAPKDSLFHTLWGTSQKDFPNGVPVVYEDGSRATTNDMQPGSIATVFPGVPNGIIDANSPVLLIRLRPGQTFTNEYNSAGAKFEDFVAFSKICTHAGCPASLYETQTGRLLCPCHQSQFDVLHDAKPVFGPATRPLPQLPLGVEIIDGVRYFVAKGDFPFPVGPGFWNANYNLKPTA